MNCNQAADNGHTRIVPVTSTPTRWGFPPATIALGDNDVHVWRVSLDESAPQRNRLLRTLAADERTKAERFHFQKDRERFVTAHGILRAILGRYLNRDPESLSFCYGSHGKPVLAGESGADALRFNMSHSHEAVLYAVTRGREIGIDVEFIRCDLEAEQIAERFFSKKEIATLRSLPPGIRQYAFFLCWTRKEAYIKARGEGLSIPLDQFDVSLIPGEPAALLSTQTDSDEALRWSLHELALGAGYAAALAAEGRDWTLTCWQWPRSTIDR